MAVASGAVDGERWASMYSNVYDPAAFRRLNVERSKAFAEKNPIRWMDIGGNWLSDRFI